MNDGRGAGGLSHDGAYGEDCRLYGLSKRLPRPSPASLVAVSRTQREGDRNRGVKSTLPRALSRLDALPAASRRYPGSCALQTRCELAPHCN